MVNKKCLCCLWCHVNELQSQLLFLVSLADHEQIGMKSELFNSDLLCIHGEF